MGGLSLLGKLRLALLIMVLSGAKEFNRRSLYIRLGLTVVISALFWSKGMDGGALCCAVLCCRGGIPVLFEL